MSGITNLSKFIYQFAYKHPNDVDDEVQTLNDILIGNSGFSYLFWLLIVVSGLTAVVYYYGIAAKAASATKQNYIVSSILGLITLLVFNFLFLFLFCDFKECLQSKIMWLITLLDIVYYFICHELWSLLIKDGIPFVNRDKSKARTIDWISIIFNK